LPLFLHSRAAHADFVRLLKDAFGPKLERLEKGGVVHSFTGTAEEMHELMDLGLYIGINGCSFKTAENCEVVKEVQLDRLMIETDGPWCEVRPTHEGWKYLIEKKAEPAPEPVPEPAPEAPKALEPTATAIPAVTDALAATTIVEGNNAETPTVAPAAPQQRQRKQKQQQQQPQKKKNQKKEPEVPDRFKVVKKEKWEEGAMVKGRNEPCTIERIAKIVAGIKGVSVEEVCEAAWANTVKVFGVGGQ